MSRSPQQDPEFNPYAPPKAAIDPAPAEESGGDLAEVEAIRRRYLNHEASVKAIGTLYLLGTLLMSASVGLLVVNLGSARVPSGGPGRGELTGISLGNMLFSIVFVTLGFGLRSLQNWARWGTVTFTLLILFTTALQLVLIGSAPGFPVWNVFTLVIMLYVLSLMFGPSARFVFSADYREVVTRTPHIRYRISWIVKALLIFLIVLLLLAFVAAFLSLRMR